MLRYMAIITNISNVNLTRITSINIIINAFDNITSIMNVTNVTNNTNIISHNATVGFTAPSVLASIAFGNYLSPLIPFIDPRIIALIVIISIHYLHMTNIRWGIIFQDSFTLIKIGLILFFIIFGFFVETNEQISIVPATRDIKIILSPEFAISLIWVSYAYT